MAPVKISFNDNSATPPVYVAGSFTNWQPVEIEPVKSDNGFIYEKTFDLTPGTYQYKFRLGPGDWWVLDASSPSNRDASGNENNEITVESEPEPKPETKSETKPETKSEPEPVSFAAATTLPTVATQEAPKPEVVAAPVATKAVEQEPTVEVNGINETEPAKVEEAPKVAKVENVNGNAVEPVAAEEKPDAVNTPVEVQEKVSQPEEKTVDETTSSKPVTKESESNGTSVSSISPKAEVTEKQGEAPKKQSWFARVFLCKSSREVVLAATIVSIPVLIAYVMKR